MSRLAERIADQYWAAYDADRLVLSTETLATAIDAALIQLREAMEKAYPENPLAPPVNAFCLFCRNIVHEPDCPWVKYRPLILELAP